MLRTINSWISSHVSLIVFSGIIVGILSSRFAIISNETLGAVLFAELFIACFKIQTSDFAEIHVRTAAAFLVVRYLLVPIGLYFVLAPWSASIATALLLVGLLPTGVSSPGFAGLFGASVATVLPLVLITSLLSPIYIPALTQAVAHTAVQVDVRQMFTTILVLVVLPLLIHFPFKRSAKFANFMVEFNPLLLIPLVWLTTVVPVSRYRAQILMSPLSSVLEIVAFWLFYAVLLFAGVRFARNFAEDIKRSFAIASCVNNITLGVVIALMYFPGDVSSLVVFANIGLTLMMSSLQFLLPIAAESRWGRGALDQGSSGV